jgi:hypothetical protein
VELGRLLGELLPAQGSPADLVRLAGGATTGPGPVTAQEFSRQLAFFERPSREQDLRRLAARLRDVQDRKAFEAELETLTRKARAQERPTSAQEVETPRRPQKPRRSLAPVVIGLACIIGVLLFAGLVVGLSRLPARAEPSVDASLAPPAEPKQPSRVTRGKSKAAARLPDSRASASSSQGLSKRGGSSVDMHPTPPLLTPPPVRLERDGVSGLTLPRGAPLEMPSTRAWIIEEVNVSATPGEPPSTMGPPALVYDRADGDVVPAMLLRPRLPSASQPNALAVARSVLDVVIAPSGQVEQVRLVRTTPERRYYDMMLLPAVKAWVFQPASLHGQPVRYRVFIPLL